MFMKRSNKTQENILMEKLLDVLGHCLQDVDDFCLTDLDIRIQDIRDVHRAAKDIGSRLGFGVKIQRRRAPKPQAVKQSDILARSDKIAKEESENPFL